MGYWLYHEGAWFVALIIPLYILIPFFHVLINRLNSYRFFIFLFLLIGCFFISSFINSDNVVVNNIQFCAQRIPGFIIGYSMARSIKNCLFIRYIKVLPIIIIIGISYIGLKKLGCPSICMNWFLILPLIVISIEFFRHTNDFTRNLFKFMGKISLESYLTNIVLISLFQRYIYLIPYNQGNYFMYFMVILIGILLAILVNKLLELLKQSSTSHTTLQFPILKRGFNNSNVSKIHNE